MLPLKLLRSLVLGDSVTNPLSLPKIHHQHDDGDACIQTHQPQTSTKPRSKSRAKTTRSRTPLLLFLPTNELVTNTYRLATIARDLGMDLRPTSSLSHIIFSYPSSFPSPSSLSSKSSSWSSSTFSFSLPNDAVPIPFPSFAASSLTHLRSFVALTKGLFKLVFLSSNYFSPINETSVENTSIWDCCSISLFSRLTGNRIDSMDDFSRALAGLGWTLFKTRKNPSMGSGENRVGGGNQVYLFRKVQSSRFQGPRGNGDGDGAGAGEECSRVRELRLPPLDFRNAPLRILQYIILMTDDIFYLA